MGIVVGLINVSFASLQTLGDDAVQTRYPHKTIMMLDDMLVGMTYWMAIDMPLTLETMHAPKLGLPVIPLTMRSRLGDTYHHFSE
jgi:hypothetical protein